jgi:fido (protein-threonine AMPylation protein)
LLKRQVALVLTKLRRGKIQPVASALDTRSVHAEIFENLTPPHFPHFAGHYRGEAFRCLNEYRVCVQGDPRVGAEPGVVADEMVALRSSMAAGFAAIDATYSTLTRGDLLLLLVRFACQAFDVFLRIHPYANGNGHAARFIIWAVLGRYDFWPNRFTVEPRPTEPTYVDLITRHRNGEPQPLITFVLSQL